MTVATIEPHADSSSAASASVAAIPASQFNIAIHNGIVTVHNEATGHHRTFRVRTIDADGDSPLAGRRVVELLTGPDNTADYQGFAFVGPVDGRVSVWRRYRGVGRDKATGRPVRTDWEKFGAMLERPGEFERRGLRYVIEGRCRRCNRVLSTPESCRTGLGPVCEGR